MRDVSFTKVSGKEKTKHNKSFGGGGEEVIQLMSSSMKKVDDGRGEIQVLEGNIHCSEWREEDGSWRMLQRMFSQA